MKPEEIKHFLPVKFDFGKTKRGDPITHTGYVVSIVAQCVRVRYRAGKAVKYWDGYIADLKPFVEVKDDLQDIGAPAKG